MKRKTRLEKASKWIKEYNGTNLVKGYSKKFKTDKICTIIELRLLGIDISKYYESKITKSLEDLKKQKLARLKKRKRKIDVQIFESDQFHKQVMGYTSNEVSFGIEHDENN